MGNLRSDGQQRNASGLHLIHLMVTTTMVVVGVLLRDDDIEHQAQVSKHKECKRSEEVGEEV